ncbi:MAG: nucleoside triphosphate pyrophosphohydrolase [bacterium]
MSKNYSFDDLTAIMKRLRGPDGCLWDKEQTRKSLTPYIIEEAYEVLEAIDRSDLDELREELGDLLLQVVFQAQIAEEQNDFDINDVISAICDKLIRRHPHVFGEKKVKDSAEILTNWEKIKKSERKQKHRDSGKAPSVLEGVPGHLPSLLRAHRVQSKAARVGFDFPDVNMVFEKVREEINEFEESVESRNQLEMEEEFGDILFSLVNVARSFGISAEDALRRTVVKFMRRFHYIEQKLHEQGRETRDLSLEEMDRLWEEAKK